MLIGVYRKNDPLHTLPERRISELVAEGWRQGVDVFFFDASSIDMEQESIKGKFQIGDSWMEKRVPLPDVILNEAPDPVERRPESENWLRRRVPFTTFLIHGKYEIQQKLETHFQEHMVPTERLLDLNGLLAFLDKHHEVIVKPDQGCRGNSIFTVKKDDQNYICRQHATERQLDYSALEKHLQDVLAQGPCIMQPYVPSINEMQEVVDFRVHIQRNGTGGLVPTKVYPRIGAPNSVISNLSKGGRTADARNVLQQLLSDDTDLKIREMERLSIRMAEEINRSYSFLIDELGMDFIVTLDGKLLFLEANISPQTRFHERERAANAIAYAQYVARAGRMVPSPVVAMLTADPADKPLAAACAYAAKWNDAEFYYFGPTDVHAEWRFIKGYVYQNEEWEARYCPFPNVVYDRLKERGNADFGNVYAALRHVPFTDERKGGSFSKKNIYEMIQMDPELSDHLIPYQAVKHSDEVLAFIDMHGTSVIKPSLGSFGEDILIVQRERGGYAVKDQQHIRLMSEKEFTELITMIAAKNSHLIQTFIRSETQNGLPFHIRLHLVRNGEGEWSFISAFPFLSTQSDHKVVNHPGSLRAFTTWDWLSRHEYPDRQEAMFATLQRLALRMADYVAANISERICELGIDVGIDPLCKVWLFEVNMNKIGSTHREFEVAQSMIPFALSLQ
ncbi:YheC/YheD family protein [Paenibacillus sp. ACRRY]|uniref:YheC/YheD family protein n=1 Tax=Paenibacillus sp. ACRRY TaxID=2918208 RepID=UPI001EF44084|nr:YheC/YheD family protein [Paenibacillus sp. ACRRY]MCG7384940.1 YheC/YheD family protein [Paenibacillus sp. ACRRY]